MKKKTKRNQKENYKTLQKVTVYTSLEGDTVRGTIFKNEGLTILRFLSDGNMFICSLRY